jgi:hypothetical protein
MFTYQELEKHQMSSHIDSHTVWPDQPETVSVPRNRPAPFVPVSGGSGHPRVMLVMAIFRLSGLQVRGTLTTLKPGNFFHVWFYKLLSVSILHYFLYR